MNQITCVVPTLNSAKTLDMTLLSLHSQENVKVSVIAVDSGSNDGTLDICKRWGVKVLYEEPGNMYRAINKGLKEADTEWVSYINSDDWYYPDSLAKLINHGESTNSDLVYGKCDFTEYGGRFLYSFAPAKPENLPSLFRWGVLGFCQQSIVFRNTLYRSLRGFNDKEYRFSADREFFTRAFLSNAKFELMPDLTVACFRLHSNQLSSDKNLDLLNPEREKIKTQLIEKVSFYDNYIFVSWKFANLPHYILRILRQSLLSRKLVLPTSMQTI